MKTQTPNLLRFHEKYVFKTMQFTKFVIYKTLKFINMFGDMMGMMGKLKETQQKIEETKNRLNTVFIDEQSNDGLLKVSISANRTIKSIEIDEKLLQDKDQLEDYLVMVMNNAIEKATQIQENELAEVAKSGMPTIPGMDMFK